MRRSLGGVRPSWRLAGGKALRHRPGAPTFCGGAHEAAGHVGALQAAKPYSTVQGRQQFVAEPMRRPAMLAPPRRQSLILPSGQANMPPRIQPSGRRGWRLAGGKALCHRTGAPTICGGAHEATDHVGAAPPAKPDSTVGPRQQAGPNPTRRPAGLAPCSRQSLMSPSRGANNMRRSP